MKISRFVLVLGLMGALSLLARAAEDKPAAAAPKDPKQQKENISYAIGMSIGNNIKRGAVELDLDVLTGAIKDIAAGKEPRLTEQQAQEALMAYQQESRTKREEERKKTADKNKADGQKFLEENKTKPGVKTIDATLPDGTKAEMEYKVITEGTGAMPKSNDTVSVNYKGTLINGKEFDSSAKRGQPAKFQVNRVVKGWTEALERMKVGSKWELYIPSVLAYGDFGSGPTIEPGSTLIFEVELLGIEAPQAAPTPQPLTSDIIKVPSAEELKKGAKIEVLKPEDVEKELKAATNKPAKKE
jgi:FKBP-type peptidyl-prolyl cis-trans isomerase FklB